MFRTPAALPLVALSIICLAGCRDAPPAASAPPPVAAPAAPATPPVPAAPAAPVAPVAAEAPPSREAPPAAAEKASTKEAAADPAKQAERREKLAKAASEKGVLGLLGSGSGKEVSDVLKGGDVSDALSGAGGVGIASGGGGVGSSGGRGGAGGKGAVTGLGSLGTVGHGSGTGSGAPAKTASAPPAPKPAKGEWPALQGVPVPTTRKFLGSPPESVKTLGDASRFLSSTLEEHGYEELGYFRYADGFAVATRPERIGGDARPVAERRWPAARMRKDAAASIQDLFEVNGEEGDRYRAFVFLCVSGATDVDYSGGANQTWGLWKTGSANPEGDSLLGQPLGDRKLTAYIYELSQDKGGKVLVATASLNTAAEHLRGAGLTAFLR